MPANTGRERLSLSPAFACLSLARSLPLPLSFSPLCLSLWQTPGSLMAKPPPRCVSRRAMHSSHARARTRELTCVGVCSAIRAVAVPSGENQQARQGTEPHTGAQLQGWCHLGEQSLSRARTSSLSLSPSPSPSPSPARSLSRSLCSELNCPALCRTKTRGAKCRRPTTPRR